MTKSLITWSVAGILGKRNTGLAFASAAMGAVMGLAVTSASAGTIISMDLGNSTALANNSSTFAGVVSAAYWNNPTGTPTFSGKPLNDSTGAASGATISGVNLASNTTSNIAVVSGDNNTTMYNRGVTMNAVQNTTGSSLQVSSLPSALTSSGYDVIVYFAAYSSGTWGVKVDDGTPAHLQTYYASVDAATPDYTTGGGFVQATSTDSASPSTGNYMRFTRLNGSSFTVTVPTGGSNQFLDVTGMQIVPTPEPASLALLALGGLLFIPARKTVRG